MSKQINVEDAPLTPLEIDQIITKEFGITPDIDISVDQKLLFIKTQIDEIQRVLWRERVDIVLSTELVNSGDEALAEKGRQTRHEKRHNAKQFTRAIKTLIQYHDQLEGSQPKLSDPEV